MVAQQSNHFPIHHCFQRVDLFDTAVSVVVSQDDPGGELAEGRAGEHSSTEPRGMKVAFEVPVTAGNPPRFSGAIFGGPGGRRDGF